MRDARCNRTPLTDAQRALAGDPLSIRYALAAVARWRRQWSWLAADIDSAALEGLVEAARSFDPANGAPFPAHAIRRAVGAVQDHIRNTVPGFDRRAKRNPPGGVVSLTVLRGERREDGLAADEGPVGWEADALAGLDELVKGLPPRHQFVLRAYYGRAGATMKQIGAEMGVTEGRASQIHAEALAMLREKFQTQEEACR